MGQVDDRRVVVRDGGGDEVFAGLTGRLVVSQHGDDNRLGAEAVRTERTERGISLEALTGIRDLVRVKKPQRDEYTTGCLPI